MRIPDEVRKRLGKTVTRDATEYNLAGFRIKEDNRTGLKQICAVEQWHMANVVDYLIEGFIVNYRQMWPDEGVYQMQLADTEDQLPFEVRPVGESPKPEKRQFASPDYLVRARSLWMYPTKSKIKKGEDVSEEMAIIRTCLDEAITKGDTQAESNITSWLMRLEELQKQ